MGHRNIQFNNHMIDLQADQGHHHNHLHAEPCIVYTNLPNYPHQNMNFHPTPEHLENPLFYYNNVHPRNNLDLNVPPPSNHYNNNNNINPYLTPPPGVSDFPVVHNLSHVVFKRKNAEGTSAGPSSSDTIAHAEYASFMPHANDALSMAENGYLRSVRNREGMVGPDSVLTRNGNVMHGNYVAPPVQLPGSHHWLDMNFNANNGEMGALAWAQTPPNLPYMHANVNGGFLHRPIGQGHSNPPMHGPRGYNNVNQMPSHGIPMIMYSNSTIDHFHDVLDAGPAFVASVPPTGFQMYRPHRGEIVYDPNARQRNFPHLRVLPEDEVAMLEIPHYHVAGESVDQHMDMRLDIDQMTYEELLALGEHIGSVGTGLSEEYIRNNLRIRFFTSDSHCINLEVAPCPDQEMVNFCVVCQMDYEYREIIGTLDCGHEYHKECIHRWLVVKNTCPVCKSTALRGKGKDSATDGR